MSMIRKTLMNHKKKKRISKCKIFLYFYFSRKFKLAKIMFAWPGSSKRRISRRRNALVFSDWLHLRERKEDFENKCDRPIFGKMKLWVSLLFFSLSLSPPPLSLSLTHTLKQNEHVVSQVLFFQPTDYSISLSQKKGSPG